MICFFATRINACLFVLLGAKNKSLKGQSALKKGLMEAMFDFIKTEMDL